VYSIVHTPIFTSTLPSVKTHQQLINKDTNNLIVSVRPYFKDNWHSSRDVCYDSTLNKNVVIDLIKIAYLNL